MAPGQIVGPYRLLFPLGKGGMGEVWASQQLGVEGFEKIVAVKVLKGTSHSENSKLMFLDEAKTAAALQHPAIVPTVDLGEHKGMLYIAMDLVQGPSLRALLQTKAKQGVHLSSAIVAHIGARMANALDYAYSRAESNGKRLKLIHRDVSPHNILIDTSGVVRLMDFGVARTSVQDHLSNVGTVRGKPSYMAPEQVTGNKLTAQTDVFALGIVMYETACLRRLFGRGEPTKSMAAVVKHEPRPLESIIPGFPKALDEIISQALEKKPENRQQDAGELFRQLSDVLRTLPEVSTIDRDLSRIVEESFGPNAFDIDTKISEFARAEEPLPPTAEETRSDRSPISSPVQDEEDPQGAAFYEALATNVFWPGAPDTGPGLSPPETYSAAFQEQGAAPLSQNRGKLSIVLLLAAFILSFALVVGVQRRQQSPKAVTTSETKKPFPLKAKTVNKATVTPNGIQQVATPKPAIKAEPQAKQNPAKPKKKKITTRTEEIREGAGKQTKKKKRATKNEVYALIKKLQAKDPEKAAQYQTTLIETGNNQKRLESLRSRVVKALRNSD